MTASADSTPPGGISLEAATTAAEPTAPPASATEISVSAGFADWLARTGCSLAFTSYRSGQLFLVGRLPDGRVSFHQQYYRRAMGLHASPSRIYVGTHFQIWRLENVLAPQERANDHFDRLYVPRNAQVTGDIDIHELSIDRTGRVVFVNTKYSCLATSSVTHGFAAVWKPPFISALAPEDRCHLNGLAMDEGEPAYVTAVTASDQAGGWRDRRNEGGLLIDVRNDRIVTEQLSMPHSPRVGPGGIWLLDSGRGNIVRIDPANGAKEEIAFLPGFLRGLAMVPGFAVVTISLPRERTFEGLPLQEELARRGLDAWCGVCIVDLIGGGVTEWIRLDGTINELFDVAIIPDTLCPMALGANSPDIQSLVTFEEQFGDDTAIP